MPTMNRMGLVTDPMAAPRPYKQTAWRLNQAGAIPLFMRPEGAEANPNYKPDTYIQGMYTGGGQAGVGGSSSGGGGGGVTGGPDELSGIYGEMGRLARRKARAPYSALRQQMEKGFARRGIDRSGFAGSALAGVNAAQQEGLAGVDTDILNQLMAMRGTLEEKDIIAKMSKPVDTSKNWLGTALGVAGGLLGGLKLGG